MTYDFNRLDPQSFEHLVQALARKILGNGTVSFGAGPDGGREATFEAKAPYPSLAEPWDGYWVVQAKFRAVGAPGEEKDVAWVKKQLIGDLKKYGSRKTKVRGKKICAGIE